jgi:hypothetical protein
MRRRHKDGRGSRDVIRSAAKCATVLNPIDPYCQGSYLVTHEASEDFIQKELQVQRRSGYGLLPLIGAGFSASSGAPLVSDLKTYLQRCMWLALGDRDIIRHNSQDWMRWHPRTDQWPPFLDRDQNKEQPNYPHELWRVLLDLQAKTDKLTVEEKKEVLVVQQGIGAMAEWRTALLFLSRLKHNSRFGSRGEASLGAERQEIVDACLREVLKGRSPSLNHTMLGVLGGALRLNLVLTTNFDDLLERAFADAKNPLQVFEVHLGDTLPHCSAVSDVRSLVKFHGNRHSLRADYSLDADPPEADKHRFLEYLLGGARDTTPVDTFRNHLLVMGIAGGDTRILELIRFSAAQLYRTDFKIFWLCFTDSDVDAAIRFSETIEQDIVANLTATSPESTQPPSQSRESKTTGSHAISTIFDPSKTHQRLKEKFVVLKHSDYGLLLLQLYQAIRRNLPPYGGIFPSISRLAVPPLRIPPALHRPSESFSQLIVERVNGFSLDRRMDLPRFLVAASDSDEHGLTSACIEAFCRLDTDNICMWLDMNDISSADNLFEVLLEAAYRRLGQENWVPTYRESDTERRAKEIGHVMSSVAKPWVIFLNARETPGANTEEGTTPHGWLDSKTGKRDESSSSDAFIRLMRQLCTGQTFYISVVLMCRAGKKESASAGLLYYLKKDGLLKEPLHLRTGMREVVKFSEEQVACDAIAWTKGDDRKQYFLHALVLMQRPRFLATIWSDAVLPRSDEPWEYDESDQKRVDLREAWLNDLEALGLIRRKPGGFIWMHSRCREKLRAVLNGSEELKLRGANYAKSRRILRKWAAARTEGKIHTKLAHWYETVLGASEAPPAIFEAVYHLCKAAESYLQHETAIEGVALACERLDSAAALLKSNTFLIQTHGYARGSCRRLNHIRHVLCLDIMKAVASKSSDAIRLSRSVQRLRIICTEVMRAIAREVGENRKGYIRHQQFAELYIQKTVKPLRKEEGDREIGSGNLSRALLDAIKRKQLYAESADKWKGPSPGIKDTAADWVRWWRWGGMLAVSTGSYDPSAKSAFKKAFQCVAAPLEYPSSETNIWPIADLPKVRDRVYRYSSMELRVEALRVVEQYAELLLLEYNLDQRVLRLERRLNLKKIALAANTVSADTSSKKQIEEVEKIVERGRELASIVRGSDHSADSQYAYDANWCESRLLIHLSICTSRRLQLHAENPSGTPHKPINSPIGLLSEAEAILRISDPHRHHSDLATIELHRAQARIWAAEAVNMKEGGGGELFSQLCDRLSASPREELQYHAATIREQFHPEYLATSLRRAKSLVEDGIHFLNRAEPVLKERRRNVWWTTWYFERYLRAIALSVWSTIFEEGTPIPFLGLEAATCGSGTFADDLLENAIRMIGVDLYRMATIVAAYASCARALQIRLLLDSKYPSLRSRRQSMNSRLTEALVELRRVEELRSDSAARKPDKSTAADDRIQRYVKLVQCYGEGIQRDLEV